MTITWLQWRLILMIMVGLGCVACSGITPEEYENEAVVGTWRVQLLNQNPVFPEGQPTIEFTLDGFVSGSTGCNTYSALYESAGLELIFREYTQVENGCVNEDVLSQESVFRGAIERVAAFTENSGQLTLYDGEGTEIMTLVKEG